MQGGHRDANCYGTRPAGGGDCSGCYSEDHSAEAGHPGHLGHQGLSEGRTGTELHCSRPDQEEAAVLLLAGPHMAMADNPRCSLELAIRRSVRAVNRHSRNRYGWAVPSYGISIRRHPAARGDSHLLHGPDRCSARRVLRSVRQTRSTAGKEGRSAADTGGCMMVARKQDQWGVHMEVAGRTKSGAGEGTGSAEVAVGSPVVHAVHAVCAVRSIPVAAARGAGLPAHGTTVAVTGVAGLGLHRA